MKENKNNHKIKNDKTIGRVGRSTPKLPRILLPLKWVENSLSWFLSERLLVKPNNPYTKGQGLREDIEWILSGLIHITDKEVMRKELKVFKANRALFFNLIASSKEVRKISLQNLPKGTPLWVPQLCKM